MKNSKKYVYIAIALATLTTLATAIPALAEDNGQNNQPNTNGFLNSGGRNSEGMINRDNNKGMMGLFGIYGTVSAVSGNTVTVTSTRGIGTNAVTTTFTVDATNAKIMKNGVAGTIASILVGDVVVVQGTVTGTNVVASTIRDGAMKPPKQGDSNKGKMNSNVYGTVSAVSGNTVTVTSTRGIGTNAVTTTFTVDATNAKIMKNGVAGTIASILVGDVVVVQGTVTGTNVVASTIRDGAMKPPKQGDEGKNNKPNQGLSAITGNGQPIIAGTVASISGSSLTVTNQSNVTYTVDATNAKVIKGPNTAVLGDVAVGDAVIVQGAINGTNVVASTILDQAKPPVSTNSESGKTEQSHGGFFNSVGSFFGHLFGF